MKNTWIQRKKEREAALRETSITRETWGRIWENPGSRAGVILLAFIVIVCVMAPVFAPYGVNDMDLQHIYQSPSLAHPFGTDGMGRDQLTRILYGGRYSLALGVCAAAVGSIAGTIIGSLAGYFGGKTETIIMRFMDI